MAKPVHTVPLNLKRASAATSKRCRDDGEEFLLRRDIDQRLDDMRVERELREVWQA